MKVSILRTILAAFVSLILFATPAFAQRNAQEEDDMILGASMSMNQANNRNDGLQGIQHCRALRDMLHNLRFHSNDHYRGAMDMVIRHCGEWDAPPPRADAAPAPVKRRPPEYGPASLTHDQSEVWILVTRADEWAEKGMALARGDERDSKFAEVRMICSTANRNAAKNVGPDAVALTLACWGRGNVMLRDNRGCDQLRTALTSFAALSGESVFAEQIGRYRAIAQTLTTTGLCAGVIEPPTLAEEEQRIKDALDRAIGMIQDILALPDGPAQRAKVKEMAALCSGVFATAFGNEHGAGTLVATCGGYAKFLADDPKGCEIIRKTYAALDLPEVRNGPFGTRALEYRERSARVIQGCKAS